jgi:MFS family permease
MEAEDPKGVLASHPPAGTVSHAVTTDENDVVSLGTAIQHEAADQNAVSSAARSGDNNNNDSIGSNDLSCSHQRQSHPGKDDLESTPTTNKEQNTGHRPHSDADLPSSRETPLHSIFPKSTRVFIIAMAATCGFVSPLSGNIYYPALNALSADLHVVSSLINISLTTYMIFQGLAPTFMGNLADTSGRRPAYIIGFTIYIGACIGLAMQTSYPALLILRCLQASGSSSTIALGSAVAADVSTAAERGTYMGWVNGGALVGPAVGPVLGGILAEFLGWRSIFWFLVILGGVLLGLLLLAFPETGRNVVGNGSIPPQRWNRDLLSVTREWWTRWHMSKVQQTQMIENLQSSRAGRKEKEKRKIRFPNPLATLKILKENDVRLLLLYNSLVYASYFSVTSSLPYLFAQTYDFNELQIGLSFIPYGVGAFLASLLNGRILDWRFRQVAKSIGFEIVKGKTTDTRHFPLERVRLPIALVLILIGNSALLCYGWVSVFSSQ